MIVGTRLHAGMGLALAQLRHYRVRTGQVVLAIAVGGALLDLAPTHSGETAPIGDADCVVGFENLARTSSRGHLFGVGLAIDSCLVGTEVAAWRTSSSHPLPELG